MSKPGHLSRPVPVPSGRLARTGRIGSMTAGIAGNMAVNGLRQWARGQQPNARDLLLTPANIRRVADQLATMRGAAMKIGQLVSMDAGDLLPPELSDIMARLRADADFMPPQQLRQVLDAAWGPNWRKRFRRFDVRPMAAASIGQVHRAQLPDGRDLAIKVQYPGVARSIDSDVASVGRLIRLSGLMPHDFKLDPYLEEARLQLHQEADYTREGQYLTRFGGLLGNNAEFRVPSICPELCTSQVLSMSYIPGRDIETLTDAPQAQRDGVATILMRLVMRELFEFRLMQTDPNFANYRYDPESGQIILLDFGATRELSSQVTGQYRALLNAGLTGDQQAISAAAQEAGFIPPNTPEPYKTQLQAMVQLVFDTIQEAPTINFGTSNLPAKLLAMGQAIAAEGYTPDPLPMEMVFIQRKLAGMFLLAARLKAQVPVKALIQEAIDHP